MTAVSINRSTWRPVLGDAHLIKQAENRAVHRLDGGGTLSDCLNVADHETARQAGAPSRLRFLT